MPFFCLPDSICLFVIGVAPCVFIFLFYLLSRMASGFDMWLVGGKKKEEKRDEMVCVKAEEKFVGAPEVESTEEQLERVTDQLRRMEVEYLKFYNRARQLEDEVQDCRTGRCKNEKGGVSVVMMGTTEDSFKNMGQFLSEFRELLSRHLKADWDKKKN